MREERADRTQIARMMRALAHPVRIWVLEELARSGEKCVCELARLHGTDDSTMSRHLTQLRVAGLVIDERRGPQVFCRISHPGVVRLLEAARAIAAREPASAPEEWIGVC